MRFVSEEFRHIHNTVLLWEAGTLITEHETTRNGMRISMFHHITGHRPNVRDYTDGMLDAKIETAFFGYFWKVARGKVLYDTSPALALAVYDFIVHSGETVAVPIIQRSVGVMDDGVIGPNTLHALLEFKPEAAIKRIQRERNRFIHNSGSSYLHGWMNRMMLLDIEIGKLLAKAQ